jgi:hypothetical protein
MLIDTSLRSLAKPTRTTTLSAMFTPGEPTAKRVIEFFAANIRNPNTRKAYAKAAAAFPTWFEAKGLSQLRNLQPVLVAGDVEELQGRVGSTIFESPSRTKRSSSSNGPE